jgi:hypothetical protein
MPFSEASYDPETAALLARAVKAAWQEIVASNPSLSAADFPMTGKLMALAVVAAANTGVRDHDRLKAVALQAANAPIDPQPAFRR